MIKIKIKPSLLEKDRYLLYEADKPVDEKTLYIKMRSFLGDLGLAKANFKFMLKKGKKGVIRVNSKYVDKVKVGLMLIKDVDIKIIKISGLINRVKEAM